MPPYAREDASLPRFALPQEELDPSEVAVTAPRPALSERRARRVIAPRLRADDTEEVRAEDILLEAYLDDDGPEEDLAGETAPLPAVAPVASSAPPVESVPGLARVAPSPQGEPRGYSSVPPPRPEIESVAPYTVAPTCVVPRQSPRRSPAIALGAGLMLALGVGLGLASALAIPDGTLARGREAVGALIEGAPVQEPAPAAAPVEPAPAKAAPVEPAPVAKTAPVEPKAEPAPAPKIEPEVTTVAVEALPKSDDAPEVDDEHALVTFPKSAAGHRIYVDGRLLVGERAPARVRCGERTIKIGSHGQARHVTLPCGEAFSLP